MWDKTMGGFEIVSAVVPDGVSEEISARVLGTVPEAGVGVWVGAYAAGLSIGPLAPGVEVLELKISSNDIDSMAVKKIAPVMIRMPLRIAGLVSKNNA